MPDAFERAARPGAGKARVTLGAASASTTARGIERSSPQVRRARPSALTNAVRAAQHSGIPASLWLAYTGPASTSPAPSPPNGSDPAEEEAPALRRARIREATYGLLRQSPQLSAAYGLWTWQLVALSVGAGLLAGTALVLPDAVQLTLLLAVSLLFLAISLLRVAVLIDVLATNERTAPPPRHTNARSDWPLYTLLVPLYDEAAVVPGLVEAMEAIDYPPDRLEVLLILEESDAATRHAVAMHRLAPNFRVVVVPDGAPRTKPRALNYAFAMSRGEFIAVFDAEDQPAPSQLKAALARFQGEDGDRLGCVQAVLEIDRRQRGWIATQFAVEYRTLFTGLLPALARWRQPIPLGGTSNHFRRRVVAEIGGWDPFNVTEDADLGLRLHRAGYRVATIGETTREEAAPSAGYWLRQRTRWIKGYVQTYAVHMRQPGLLWRELGPAGFVTFQCIVGGQILSALVHPWFYAALASGVISGRWLLPATSALEAALMLIASFNLIAGYVSALALTVVAGWRQRRPVGFATLATMPLYWLMISAAAYRAVWQFARAPHLWEKTRHRARPSRRRRRPIAPVH